MARTRLSTNGSTSDAVALDQFYEHVESHTDTLNPKFQNKALITHVLSEKIIDARQNELLPKKPLCCDYTIEARFLDQVILGIV